MIILVLIGIAFLTLLERKILSYIQNRKGPNKVGILGIFQPFRDALKLFSKELFFIDKSNYYIYYMCPILRIFLMLCIWLIYPVITNIYFINYSVLIIIGLIRISGYLLLLIGWSSNSVYSIIGSIRSVAQRVSYEVRFIIIILIIIILSERYRVIDFVKWQENCWYIIRIFPVFLIFFIRVLAELNRSPIDFIEGESELVSGFNVEYFSGGFALIFIAEYGIIIFFRLIIILIFTNLLINRLIIYMFINLLRRLVIFMRGILPRMRYDELIYLCWKIILPLILGYIILILGVKSYFILVI